MADMSCDCGSAADRAGRSRNAAGGSQSDRRYDACQRQRADDSGRICRSFNSKGRQGTDPFLCGTCNGTLYSDRNRHLPRICRSGGRPCDGAADRKQWQNKPSERMQCTGGLSGAQGGCSSVFAGSKGDAL